MSRSYWRPLTEIVSVRITFAHGPEQAAGGDSVPENICWFPLASLDGKRSASVCVQWVVAGPVTGGAAVTGSEVEDST